MRMLITGGRSRRAGPGPGVRSCLGVVLADVVHPDHAGRAGHPGRRARGDDHDVALLAAADAQQFLVDLLHHLVGGLHGRAEEGLHAPRSG